MLLFFLAELLEMLQLDINVEGGHLVHGGCFGLSHSHLLMQCISINQRMYCTGLFGDSDQGVAHADILGPADVNKAVTACCPPVPPSSSSSCSGATVWINLFLDSTHTLVPVPLPSISIIYFQWPIPLIAKVITDAILYLCMCSK